MLPGGGARGAYEAGALSVLLPELERRGERVTIFCGTSVGAINAAALAALAHLPGSEQARLLTETWSRVSKGAVTGRLIGPRLLLGAARLVGEAFNAPGVRFRGFIEAEPMRRSIERWIDWDQLHLNVDDGVVDAVCTVATSLRTGQPVGFVERASGTAPEGGACHMPWSRRLGGASSARSPSRSSSGATAACGRCAIPTWRSWPRSWAAGPRAASS